MTILAKQRKLWALLGILVFFLLNFPLLQICNHIFFLAGIPILILYLHGVWITAIIGLYALRRLLASQE